MAMIDSEVRTKLYEKSVNRLNFTNVRGVLTSYSLSQLTWFLVLVVDLDDLDGANKTKQQTSSERAYTNCSWCSLWQNKQSEWHETFVNGSQNHSEGLEYNQWPYGHWYNAVAFEL